MTVPVGAMGYYKGLGGGEMPNENCSFPLLNPKQKTLSYTKKGISVVTVPVENLSRQTNVTQNFELETYLGKSRALYIFESLRSPNHFVAKLE